MIGIIILYNIYLKNKIASMRDQYNFMVESMVMTWNLIKRQLIVASEIYESVYVASLIVSK